jgi:hypothetical protein
MDNEVISKAEADEDILTFDAPDEVLERAGSAEQAFTWVYCTNSWYYCEWPQQVLSSSGSLGYWLQSAARGRKSEQVLAGSLCHPSIND